MIFSRGRGRCIIFDIAVAYRSLFVFSENRKEISAIALISLKMVEEGGSERSRCKYLNMVNATSFQFSTKVGLAIIRVLRRADYLPRPMGVRSTVIFIMSKPAAP